MTLKIPPFAARKLWPLFWLVVAIVLFSSLDINVTSKVSEQEKAFRQRQKVLEEQMRSEKLKSPDCSSPKYSETGRGGTGEHAGGHALGVKER